MKGLEITLDGVKYFVSAHLESDRDKHTLVLELYLGSLRSAHIYHEYLTVESPEALRKFDKRAAKKFIKRAFEK